MSDVQRRNIESIMRRMQPLEVRWFNDFYVEEQEYILELIKSPRGCRFETNGTASDAKSITKFRKLPPIMDNTVKYVFELKK